MAQEQRSSRFWPIFLSILLLLGIAGSLWFLWNQQAIRSAESQKQKDQAAALRQKVDELRALLALSPCEAREKLVPVPPQGSVSPVSQDPNADNIESACVFIIALKGKNKVATGTGFFVAPGYVVTNKHVVGRSSDAFITSKALGQPIRATVVATSDTQNRDYALLKVDLPPGCIPVSLPFAADVHKTEKVGAWGFPNLVGRNDPGYAGLLRGDMASAPELSYTEGVVSAILPRNPDIIVHTAPISPGNSGGPLLNEKGEVIGINTMISLDDSSYRQASLALAAADLRNFLKIHNIAN